MASVLTKSKAINHFLCLLPAARHKANPFQGKTQIKLMNESNIMVSSGIGMVILVCSFAK